MSSKSNEVAQEFTPPFVPPPKEIRRFWLEECGDREVALMVRNDCRDYRETYCVLVIKKDGSCYRVTNVAPQTGLSLDSLGRLLIDDSTKCGGLPR